MRELFVNTVFGAIVRKVTRGRYLDHQDNYDAHLRAIYLSSKPKLNTAQQEKLGEEAHEYHIIDWIENDPQNPRNWSIAKKCFTTFQICLLTTSVYIGAAIYSPGIYEVAGQFSVSLTVALLGLTLFVIGYGVGPMLWAPMSEMPFFGRNPVYVGTLAVFVAFQPAVFDAKNIGMLLAFRFLTGVFGSPVLATGGAALADLFKPSKRAYAMSIWGISNAVGPILGPLIGGFATQAKGWKWGIYELMWLSGFALVFLFFFLPETSASNIIFKRTQRLRKHLTSDKSDMKIACAPELEAMKMTPKDALIMTFVQPFQLAIMEPVCLALHLYIALVYALLYLWFESFPLVFGGIYHFNAGLQGVAFCGILVTAVSCLPMFWVYMKFYLEHKFNADGELKPELRMQVALPGAFAIPISLFIFAWTSRPDVHWIGPVIGSSIFSYGAFGLFTAVLNYLGDAYPDYAGAVYAGNDLFRACTGAAFPLFANALFTKLGIDWGCSLLGFISIAFIPLPFILYYKGEALRKRSRFARHDL